MPYSLNDVVLRLLMNIGDRAFPLRLVGEVEKRRKPQPRTIFSAFMALISDFSDAKTGQLSVIPSHHHSFTLVTVMVSLPQKLRKMRPPFPDEFLFLTVGLTVVAETL